MSVSASCGGCDWSAAGTGSDWTAVQAAADQHLSVGHATTVVATPAHDGDRDRNGQILPPAAETQGERTDLFQKRKKLAQVRYTTPGPDTRAAEELGIDLEDIPGTQ